MKITLLLLLVISSVFFNPGCIPPNVSKGETDTQSSERVRVNRGDTLTYTVEFFNKSEKDAFVKKFSHFMNSYPFSALSYDSTYNQISIRIFQSDSAASQESISTVQRFLFSEDSIEDPNMRGRAGAITVDSSMIGFPVDTSVASEDTILAEFGGTLRIYSNRSSLDQTLSQFTHPDLSMCIGDSGFFSITDTTPHKITITLNDKVVNAHKRTISTLDLIQQWTSFVKNSPAEGIALFSGVEGIMEFISGKEALIRGFNAIDQKTIQIRFASPQPLATTRIRTPRIIVPSLLLGPYYQEKSENETVLLPNTVAQKRTAYLDKIILKTGGDPNPVLSFSLNRYDALILNSLNDINYARTTLAQKAVLYEITGDRYFVACKIQDSDMRSTLRDIINPETILNNYLKVEGEVISATASDLPLSQNPPLRGSIKAGAAGTIKILYRNDDFISKSVAEKLFADFSNAGINGTLSGMDVTAYERALVAGDYHCAVGWVAKTVVNNLNEKLRLASIWFNNDTDEEKRIQDFREIPLFSVNTYLCTRKNIQLYKGELKGIYIAKDQQHLQN